METITIKEDISVLTYNANSFPEGIAEAHHYIQRYSANLADRTIFGISRPENGKIIYRAAIKESDMQNNSSNLDKFIIKKGDYISIFVEDYLNDAMSIYNAFQILTKHTGIDPEAYCIEWYLGENNVRCMIKLL